MRGVFIWFIKNKVCKRKREKVTMAQDKRIREYKVGEWSTIEMEMRVRESESELGIYCEEAMSGQGEGVLASRGTRSAFVFLGVIVFSIGILEDKGGEGFSASAKGCLCRLGVKVIGHGDGS